MNFETITSIQKENIPGLEFQNHEVLPYPEQVEHRKAILHKAMILGNTNHTKVKLVFESLNGIFQVETTIWAATDAYILLKGGVYLPIRCILDVTFL